MKGPTPRQSSTGGKMRLVRVTKMDDRYLRKLLLAGASQRTASAKAFSLPPQIYRL